ncbi:MAG: methyl-accepting chemotaxis protein [Desulfovibrio sp.]|uniref:methyl-accepting chemotaxis protein n=1 Tax=Desulfovibrio sp. 7SRBS1 TaxID=3378064 RepID=UPI003B40A8C2
MLRKFSIQVRVLFILGVMALFIAGIVYALILNTGEVSQMGLAEVEQRMLDGQKAKLKVAVHSIAVAASVAAAQEPTKEGKKKLIRAMLKDLRFEEDSSGYYFAYEGTVCFAHVSPKSIGQDKKDMADPNGVRPLLELFKKTEKGGGFVSYVWPKPNMGTQPKLSYAEAIPGTDFWVGSGVYIDNIQATQKKVAEKINTRMNSTLRSLLIGIVIIFVLVLVIAIAIVRSIVRPIGEAAEAARHIASGDLNISLDERGNDEAAQLERALNSMVATLQTNIEEITAKTREAEDKAEAAAKATEQAEEATRRAERAKAEGMAQAAIHLEEIVARIAEASDRISGQSEEIRRGTDIQRDRVQETATAMEEMNATVLEVARNAGSAAEKGQESRDKAQEGKGVVEKSVRAVNTTQKQTMELKDNMNALVNQAEAIGNILNVITDIADQTNLLALNAAIEAARAGDAGRGFAVVADEVRKLAEKTMGATKEVGEAITAIQTVIRSNTDSVDQTVTDLETVSELSTHSGEMLEQIVSDATESAEQIQSIATAAEEQSATSEEINRSVEEINRITIETAQGITESVNALRTLSDQVGQLEELVGQLKNQGAQA